MYELDYVRKRKKKKIVAFVGGISAVVVSTFAIVAFLGRFVGTFTVNLEARNVDLALMGKQDSDEHSTFIRVDAAAPFQEFTYSYFDRFYGGDEQLDNEETSYKYGAKLDADDEAETFNFFKFTFYLGNTGSQAALFDWSLNIVEDVKSSDGQSLTDTLRAMVYVDGEKTIYGKALEEPRIDEEGNLDYRAPVSVDEDQADEVFPFMGYAEMFESSNVITSFNSQLIDIDETRRYTIVVWLEGFRSNSDQFAPRGAKLKLGVDINAYENK